MDDCLPTREVFSLPIGGGTVLQVIYTNEEHALESALANFEQWLEPEKHKFLGLDLEYTCSHAHKPMPSPSCESP